MRVPRGHPKGVGWETSSFVPRSEINGLISQADEGLDRAFLSLLYLSGARISEVLRLRERDLLDEDGYLSLNLVTLKTKRRPSLCGTCGASIVCQSSARLIHLSEEHGLEVHPFEIRNYFRRDDSASLTHPVRRVYAPTADTLFPYIRAYREQVRKEAEQWAPQLIVPRTWHLFPRRITVYGWTYRVDFDNRMSAVRGWQIVKKYQPLIAGKIDEGKIFPH